MKIATRATRTAVVVAAVLVMVALTATEALANIRGERCVTHMVAGQSITVCPSVNVHDFWQWKQGRLGVHVSQVDTYVDWVKLYRDGNVVATFNSDQWTLSSGQVYTTDWYSACDSSDDWQAKVRAKYRSTGGVVTQFFTDSSFVVHTSGCG